jgi:phosphohistidine phosphatase
MKTLLLLRHAKSSWNDDSLEDHERPLNKRGKKTAPRMGQLVRDEGIVPDLIVASTANRAKTTANIVAEKAGYRGEVRLEPALYLAPPERYLRIASKVDDAVDRLMLVGHNPGIEMCVDLLCGCNEVMPTAGLAVISLPIDAWSEISLNVDGRLEAFWRPKELT